MVDAVRRYLNPSANMDRFTWLYRGSPAGAAKAWIAEDVATGAAVGMAAAFPRTIYLGGHEARGWILGDFCVAEEYRALGPALQLQKACLAGIAATGDALAYDLPGGRMLPLYRRLGIRPFGRLLRLAKPLRVDGWLGRRLPAVVARALSPIGNGVLARLDARHRVDHGLTVRLQAGPFGQEFSDLARRVGTRQGFCLMRSAEYLDWRYHRAPHAAYRCLAARRRDELVGFAVLERQGDAGWIVDLFGEDDAVVRSLAVVAVARLRADGAVTATLAILDGHPWVSTLSDLGFRSREVNHVVVCSGDGREMTAGVAAGGPWLFLQGDRES